MNDHTHALPPGMQLLSNGRYSVTISAAGTGQSRRHGHVVNRWTGDPVEDGYGQFLFLHDLDSDEIWSVGSQPLPGPSTRYTAAASPGKFHIEHECHGIAARLDVAVAQKDDLEVRRLRLVNPGRDRRRIEVTSYFEAVLNWQGADIAHPAFSKLFLQTDYFASESMLVVNRRPRANGEHWPTLFHALAGEKSTEWETDRLRFLGRGRMAGAAIGLRTSLSGTVGNVLDPCCTLRTVIELPAGEERTLTFLTGIAETREAAVEMVGRLRTDEAVELTLRETETAGRGLQTELGISSEQAARFLSLVAAMHAGDRRVAASEPVGVDVDASAVFGKLGIPRDRMLMIALEGWDASATRELKLAREYFGRHGFFTNLLVIDADLSRQPAGLDDRVFTRLPSSLEEGDRPVLINAASVVVHDRIPRVPCDWSPRRPATASTASPRPASPVDSKPLEFFNGFGGFTSDGREYVIQLPWLGSDHKWPPLPWVNVIANEKAGFLVSESGAGCTWARNSQANRITPWSNEPVRDPYGEALYLRDEETGELFSPLPGPVRTPVAYEVRHGFGYSTFVATSGELDQETTLFVPKHDPIKVVLLKLKNRGPSARRLSVTAYQELILGGTVTRPSLVVTHRAGDDSLRAVNLAAGDFKGGIVFCSLTVDGAKPLACSFTCNRASFLGRFGSPENPAALNGSLLDGSIGAGFDPCFAQQQTFTIDPGAEVECVLLLGEVMREVDAQDLINKYRRGSAARAALADAQNAWRSSLERVQVETPSRKLNFMVNGWLPYQTLACRLWARSGFYQSSGAFGFRDQLQDAGNLLALEPRLARDQILLHACHQFVEGDVLHWWHAEPIGRGLRTRFSDDLLWLPLVAAEYVRGTGDAEILDEVVPFIEGPPLGEGEDEVYISPRQTGVAGTLYEHCCRAIDCSLKTGAHGLPLMGCGDWNDGMNRVGREGRGESVWLGFFLDKILGDILPHCRARNDDSRVARYSAHQSQLRTALNEGGWDGEWYRRAYYDNGDPLGSQANDECRIDAIAQAWAIISGAAPEDRARSCMAAMARELISESDGIIRLLTPPFENTPNDPGYIKGYVAGIRENGGQYTHAACWAVMAMALQGEKDRALRLWEMLAPISHGESEARADHYKGEPYVLPGDVYGAAPHIGRCGWTWYTGSSGWLYRVGLESILGVRIEDGRTLVVSPCVPDEWPGYRVTLNRPIGAGGSSSRCVISVENRHGRSGRIVEASSDGVAISVAGQEVRVPLRDDGGEQQVQVVLG